MTLRRAVRVLLVLANVAAGAFLVVALERRASVAGLNATGGRAELTVPAGFVASVFAEGLSAPRFLALGPDSRLYVAEAGRDRVVALADTDGDGVSDAAKVFADHVSVPHSLAWHDGSLFAGVPSGVVRLRDTDGDGVADDRRKVVDGYPVDGHSTRTVAFLPDGRMAVSMGSSCNVCVESDKRRAGILVYDGGDGAGERMFATGLRNAVGLAVDPRRGTLWATNNGRDWLGDDVPPDTLQAVREGDDFGWPRCHAGDLVDPDFGSERGCDGVAAPDLKLQAHSAPLGLAFVTGPSFPDDWQGDLLVAFHGSWNRSVPTGYKVVRVKMKDGVPAAPPGDFVTGFVETPGGRVLGRPVGLAFGADGALYVSDDKSGYVYRITARRTGP